MTCHSRVPRVSSLTQSTSPTSRSNALRPCRLIEEGVHYYPYHSLPPPGEEASPKFGESAGEGPSDLEFSSLPPPGEEASPKFGESAGEGPSDLEFSCGMICMSAWSSIARLLVGPNSLTMLEIESHWMRLKARLEMLRTESPWVRLKARLTMFRTKSSRTRLKARLEVLRTQSPQARLKARLEMLRTESP
ncbi:hypothetical protein B296_00031309 [Ensete ventricosum]|uniref:Uncharacterized protein n=1 Tax=Ensete ventricosum TaxID=4639 RepID=A0A426YKL0_ENSVE|nr:hypothetical protein B296_00031309 [Ensete ventricosum]